MRRTRISIVTMQNITLVEWLTTKSVPRNTLAIRYFYCLILCHFKENIHHRQNKLCWNNGNIHKWFIFLSVVFVSTIVVVNTSWTWQSKLIGINISSHHVSDCTLCNIECITRIIPRVLEISVWAALVMFATLDLSDGVKSCSWKVYTLESAALTPAKCEGNNDERCRILVSGRSLLNAPYCPFLRDIYFPSFQNCEATSIPTEYHGLVMARIATA